MGWMGSNSRADKQSSSSSSQAGNDSTDHSTSSSSSRQKKSAVAVDPPTMKLSPKTLLRLKKSKNRLFELASLVTGLAKVDVESMINVELLYTSLSDSSSGNAYSVSSASTAAAGGQAAMFASGMNVNSLSTTMVSNGTYSQDDPENINMDVANDSSLLYGNMLKAGYMLAKATLFSRVNIYANDEWICQATDEQLGVFAKLIHEFLQPSTQQQAIEINRAVNFFIGQSAVNGPSGPMQYGVSFSTAGSDLLALQKKYF